MIEVFIGAFLYWATLLKSLIVNRDVIKKTSTAIEYLIGWLIIDVVVMILMKITLSEFALLVLGTFAGFLSHLILINVFPDKQNTGIHE